jgi:hypothetical protein
MDMNALHSSGNCMNEVMGSESSIYRKTAIVMPLELPKSTLPMILLQRFPNTDLEVILFAGMKSP